MKPLRAYPVPIQMVKGQGNPSLGITPGALFATLVQSSSAFTGIVIDLAQQRMVTLDIGIPMIFGEDPP